MSVGIIFNGFAAPIQGYKGKKVLHRRSDRKANKWRTELNTL